MILIVTNKTDYTADFLILELLRRNIDFVRFNTEDYPSQIELSFELDNSRFEGALTINNRRIDLHNITSVWYRRPLDSQPHPDISDSVAQEYIVTESKATLGGLWRVLSCLWVSHPDNIRAAEFKPYQLKLASELGFTIPSTLITNVPDEAINFRTSAPSTVIFKPQRYGYTIREDSLAFIYTSPINEIHTNQFDKVRYSPVLFQQYMPKKEELRVTVVGNKIFPVKLLSQELDVARHDWRRADPKSITHIPCELPQIIKDRCIQLVQTLGLKFGAIDLILTPQGEYIFLEINPNGQWAWIEQVRPDVQIRSALIELLTSASIN